MHQKLTRTMLDIAIDKSLKEIRTKSKRGIRNLVDLGAHFAKGRFQEYFYQIAQKMLENMDSPYYDLVFNTVNNVDNNILKNFGVNIGLNSWTYGVNTIREKENCYGYNIPWAIIFDFTTQTTSNLESSDILKLIKDGKATGIFSYIAFIDENTKLKENLFKVFEENQDCAFILFAGPKTLDINNILKIRDLRNILISINMEEMEENQELLSTVESLKENKCLYGIHSIYDDEDSEIILNNEWINKIVNLNSTFAFLIHSKNCSKENIAKVSAYIKDMKTNQKYPTFLIDFYEDMSYISRVISSKSCFLKILQDGKIITDDDNINSNLNITNMKLEDIFSFSC